MSRKILGKNAVTTREDNIALIIRLLIENGICSRADLAQKTGLTQASITYIVRDLINWGLVRETGTIEGKTRHPSIGIAVSREKFRIIGIQLNRGYLRSALLAPDGAVLLEKYREFPRETAPREILTVMHACIGEMLGSMEPSCVPVGIGIALPGPYLPAKGKIELMSGSPGWAEIDLEAELSHAYRLPVVLEHDANCGALAELRYGGGDTGRNLLFVNIADGIGAGIITDGHLYRGQLGIAGEIGHMSINFNGPRCECGNRGCMELYCSLRRLKAEYEEICLSENGPEENEKTAEDILRSAANGESHAVEALRRCVFYLGIGLANIVNIINPGVIILSDRFAEAGETLVSLVRENISRYLLSDIAVGVNVRLSSEPCETIVLRGSAVAVMERLLQNPAQHFGSGADM